MTEYSDKKRKGNIGEAFVQCVLSSFCLVHKIDGSQDLGNDFICEITKGKYPSNILFYVQVKYWREEPKDSDLRSQLEYWEGSPIPVYLFWINERQKLPFEILNNLDLKQSIPQLSYKRYTPITHGNKELQIKKYKPFSKFTFLRDVMVDYARCQYKRGMATVIKKSDFTEIEKFRIPIGDNCLFVNDVIPNEYTAEFIANSWANLIAASKSLYTKYQNDQECLNLALDHAILAKRMILFGDPELAGFIKHIDKIIDDIKNSLKTEIKINKRNKF